MLYVACRLLTADCVIGYIWDIRSGCMTANCQLWTVDCQLQTADCVIGYIWDIR